jgi:hypothetical protein
MQGRKRGTVLVRHRSFDLHRFIVLAPIRVVQVVLDSCRRALHSVLMFVMSYNYEFIDLKYDLISINLIVFNSK